MHFVESNIKKVHTRRILNKRQLFVSIIMPNATPNQAENNTIEDNIMT